MLDALQVRDLGSNVSQMIFRDDLNLGAGPGLLIDQPEQPANLFERKTEISGPHDEFQPSDMGVIVAAIAFRAARRVRHDADLFVIADGFKIAARCSCQITPPN